jgi:hypothetical protein
MTTPQQLGVNFENDIHKFLSRTNKTVLRENDIKKKFGMHITAIDHLIELDNTCLCFQDKYQKFNISNSQISHFISCVNNLSMAMQKKCIGIYISNNDLSSISKQQVLTENMKNNNIFINFFDNNIDILYKKLLLYFYENNLYMYEGSDCIMIDSQ